MSGGWIGVDLDGTLAHYDQWRGADHIGEVIPAMRDRVLRWLDEGREVRIFTARVSGGPDSPDVLLAARHVQDWLVRNGMPRLQVTNVKDYAMLELWDDRAVQVQANTGLPMCRSPWGLDS